MNKSLECKQSNSSWRINDLLFVLLNDTHIQHVTICILLADKRSPSGWHLRMKNKTETGNKIYKKKQQYFCNNRAFSTSLFKNIWTAELKLVQKIPGQYIACIWLKPSTTSLLYTSGNLANIILNEFLTRHSPDKKKLILQNENSQHEAAHETRKRLTKNYHISISKYSISRETKFQKFEFMPTYFHFASSYSISQKFNSQ